MYEVIHWMKNERKRKSSNLDDMANNAPISDAFEFTAAKEPPKKTLAIVASSELATSSA